MPNAATQKISASRNIQKKRKAVGCIHLTLCTSCPAGSRTCEVLKIGYLTSRSRTDCETIERAECTETHIDSPSKRIWASARFKQKNSVLIKRVDLETTKNYFFSKIIQTSAASLALNAHRDAKKMHIMILRLFDIA